MRICVVGTGYVGLVSGSCLAEVGNDVICVDEDEQKILGLKNGEVPIYEPGLEEIVRRNLEMGRLSFISNVQEGVEASEVVFITVGTPSMADGSADLSYVETVCRQIAKTMNGYTVVAEKSTVPVKTCEWVKRTLKMCNGGRADFDVVSVPEFLREGSAVRDFLHPERIVIGVETERAEITMRKLFAPFEAPIIITDIKSAELIKHASNSFLALKISYINAVANICEQVGADVIKVAEGMGFDSRIGREFLDAGIGYGGSCFPKDVAAFINIADDVGYNFELLKMVEKVNREQRQRLVKKIREALWVLRGKVIGVLGLSFKPNTDDVREAPSLEIVQMLQAEGAKIRAYDPAAMEKAREFLKDVRYCQDPYEVAQGSDALVILTEWDEFKGLDLRRIKGLLNTPIIVDGRNIFDSRETQALGFEYKAVGR